MASKCEGYLANLCAVGGTCVVNNVTNKQFCLCDQGHGPDVTLFHPVVPDCTLPSNAYLGMVLFQSLTGFCVAYRLYHQTQRGKGLLRELTASWLSAVVVLSIMMVGILIQRGFYEVAAVMLGLGTNSIIYGAYVLMELLVDARYSMEMRNSEKAVLMIHISKYGNIAVFTLIAVLQAVYARTSMFNATIKAWAMFLLICVGVLGSVLLFHNQMFILSLQRVIKQVHVTRIGPRDERPAVLARLRIFRTLVVLVMVVIGPLILTGTIFFIVVGNFPFMWIAVGFVLQVINLMGLLLDLLNRMIIDFQNAKERALLDQNAQASSEPQAPTNDSFSVNRSISDKYIEPVLFFPRSRTVFVYIFPKGIPVLPDSIFYYMCGQRAALNLLWMCRQIPFMILVHLVSPLAVVLGSVVLISGDRYISIETTTIIVLGFCFPFLAVPVLALASLRQIKLCLLQSSTFQLRLILLLVTYFVTCDVLHFDLRVGLLMQLYIPNLVTLILDTGTKEKVGFIWLMYLFSIPLPFLTWMLLNFDFISQPRFNRTFAGGFFSLYHFAMDMNTFLVWLIFLDGMRLMKYGIRVFLHLRAPMRVRYTQLNDEIGSRVQEGEVDLSSGRVRRGSSVSSIGSPRQRTRARRKQPTKQTKIYVNQLLIREEDALLFSWFMSADDEKGSRLLRWMELNSFLLTCILDLLMTHIPLLIWVSLVLTQVAPPALGIICIVSFGAALFRLLFKSRLVLMFIMKRADFILEILVMFTGIAFLGVTFIEYPSRPDTLFHLCPLLSLALVFLDWRTSDALVNPKSLHPQNYPVAVLMAIVYLGMLPCFAFSNLIPVAAENAQSYFELSPSYANLSFAGDSFLLEQPPTTFFSRIRYSQIALDALLVFTLRTIVRYVERVQIQRANKSSNIVVLEYIQCPISPLYCSFDDQLRSVVEADQVLHVDERTLSEAQLSQFHSSMAIVNNPKFDEPTRPPLDDIEQTGEQAAEKSAEQAAEQAAEQGQVTSNDQGEEEKSEDCVRV